MTNISWKVALPVALAFVIGGLNQVLPMLPGTWAALGTAILSALAVYNHGTAVQIAAGVR